MNPVNAPHFGGAYRVIRFKQDGEEVTEWYDQNRMLTDYLQRYSGFDDIEHDRETGLPNRLSGSWFDGYWRRNHHTDAPVILTTDERGDHFEAGKHIVEKEGEYFQSLEIPWDEIKTQTGCIDDEMEDLVEADAIPVELEEIFDGSYVGYRLNVVSQGGW